MGLAFYDDQKIAFGVDPLRTFHDGHLGSVMEKLIYIRNDDAALYFTNVEVAYLTSQYQDVGEYGTSGWGVKYMYGQRRPTEAEWDLVRPGEALLLPDIGTTLAADISTYHPIWVRVVCPGNQAAQIREGQTVQLSFFSRLVGA
jgi:hypothetical protein